MRPSSPWSGGKGGNTAIAWFDDGRVRRVCNLFAFWRRLEAGLCASQSTFTKVHTPLLRHSTRRRFGRLSDQWTPLPGFGGLPWSRWLVAHLHA
ncbi:hypothetical protein IF1G_07030 [Cordyceps javanica]|uniref:Uncharacterized protein n=1 Tax=Cordyceps javanica TaxID=43265 RepID=A0A545UXG3_9HYPO|nr:hypothetical protein IF1G_07030 [Cordyceps javanica]